MITVNLGTGTPEEARDWVEYCNGRPGTVNADLREKGGAESSYGVPLWCLGNEMDGNWQIGHVPARDYALRAQQAARMMKAVDASIELVACGSCGISMPTYMEWDLTVLDYVGELADYVSLHRYVGNPNSDLSDYLAVTNSVDRQIEEMDAACRFVQAKSRSDRRAYLCFDEWNVWYKKRDTDGGGAIGPSLVEEVYNLEDALVVAGFLNSFIRHADVVKIANLAQIVNVIAPLVVRGDRLLVQSTFYPFEMFSRRRRGTSLRPAVSGPTYVGKKNGRVHYVDTSAIVDGQRLHVFLVNRSEHGDSMVKLQTGDRQITAIESAEVLTGPGPKAENTLSDPNLVSTRQFRAGEVHRGAAVLRLPPLSVTALTFVLD
jgi:alpha-N-arabinofuranosidase